MCLDMSQKMVVIPYERYITLKQLNLDNSRKVDSGLHYSNEPRDTETSRNIDENPENESLLSVDDIVEYMPKTYRHRCRLILHHMKQNLLSWDSFGRLIIRDECLLESHIVDLIRDVISTYKRPCTSDHSNDFKKLLMVTHCPRSILNKTNDETSQINKT